MTDQEFHEIKKRVESATKGPWKSYIQGRDHSSGSNFIMTGIEDGKDIWSKSRGEDIQLSGATIDDQDFIANARQDIPKLLEEILRLKQEIQSIRNNGK